MFDSPTYTPNGRPGDRAIFAVSNMFVMEDTRFVTLPKARPMRPLGEERTVAPLRYGGRTVLRFRGGGRRLATTSQVLWRDVRSCDANL
ncbi:MAG TPA: hypothetical protein VHU23_09140 [Rhizomicrobium sp.]|jgi:hypothetical protein|nr:hypothetical protein [Rhizomicrobium sp.]